ncbi:MAG: AarF/ABC1/UbiB kinase family protein [Gemmatimonadetes bacterium]|nr:AarF/ABC1/UbiB kinase family protein [Gemmatimonadota bacterium]
MRVVSILRHAIPLIVSVLRDRKRWLLWGKPAERTAAFHQRRAARVLRSITTLGPSFVKLGQLLAGRTDLLPAEYAEAFNTLTDRVPPVPAAAIRATVERAIGAPIEDVFDRFDLEPIAAGSLGQVHRARWRGREVAVKVLRPGVRALVATDLVVARRLTGRISQLMPNVHTRALLAIVEEFERRIGDEMDFAVEARNLEAVRANFARNPRIRIPEAILALSGPDLLVMEFVSGTRIDALERGRSYGGLGIDAIVERLQELYIQMMLIDGLFHADPHPGNVLVDETGRIVLLDFGVVIQVDRTRRRQLVDTVFAAIQNQAPGVVDGFYALGLVEPGADRAQIERLVELLLDLAAQRTTTRERIELLTREILQELYNWPIRLPSDLVYFARTSTLIEGVGVRYDPTFNPIMSAGPLLWRMRTELMRSLADTKAVQQLDWPTAVGYLLGRAAAKLTSAGEAVAAWFAPTTPRPVAPVPPATAPAVRRPTPPPR